MKVGWLCVAAAIRSDQAIHNTVLYEQWFSDWHTLVFWYSMQCVTVQEHNKHVFNDVCRRAGRRFVDRPVDEELRLTQFRNAEYVAPKRLC